MQIAKNRGFTLVEIMIVVVVLGILASIVVGRYVKTTDSAYDAHAHTLEKTLQNGLSMYLANYKRPPSYFFNWVALSEGGSQRNYVRIDGSARAMLKNPAADVMSNDGRTLTMTYKSGLVATYTLDPSAGTISATYTNP